MQPSETAQRVAVAHVWPEIEGGRFPIKRIIGDVVTVDADVFADGHDAIACALRFRHQRERRWNETPMALLSNDRRRGAFVVDQLGRYHYTIVAWPDPFATWLSDFAKWLNAGNDIRMQLAIAAELVNAAAARARGADRTTLRAAAARLGAADDGAVAQARDPDLQSLVARYADRSTATAYDRELEVIVDRERARCAAWYELFPRSTAPTPGRHGTFADMERRLPYVAELGFDVVYFPPIHPIGVTNRKGKNNAPFAGPGDPGSPWAIGAGSCGHDAIHPDLGTLDDFAHLLAAARALDLEVALDLAFQCSPDHPYVRDHPEWFRRRSDGAIQFAENPPKKYEDIYPLDFTTISAPALWEELRRVVEFWIGQGVRIFRVDNPHTKPFTFWQWLLTEIGRAHPDVIFLSEAFTRPNIMYRLAALGFSQSYTYFAWRNTRAELTDYFTELTQTSLREYFRPNLWPNTPDILTAYLVDGGRSAFVIRFVLAATLGASYGIYGPAFELCEATPLAAGKEEYLNSEKFEIRHWDLDRPESLREIITRVNTIRRTNPALQADVGLRFHPTDNENLLVYSKSTPDAGNVVLVAVNLDPLWVQSGWTDLSLSALGLDPARPIEAHDLLTDTRHRWRGPRNFVQLDPAVMPAHIFRLTQAPEAR
ncbi:MAG TPA: alpha-1,4-glucan--maltose-1-phosphate maltosyltransferase [bacterium]